MKTNRHLLIYAIMALILPLFASAAVTVENVTAKQRYPWNGKVDISYTVSGELSAAMLPLASLKVTAKDCDTGTSYSASSLTGDISTAAGTHAIVWDAAADLGEVCFTNMVVSVNVRFKGQLWENGPIWAEKNIGAENPWDCGLYFWWGDTVGYKREGNAWVASNGSSQNFSFSPDNTPTYGKDNSTLQSEGWITANGVLVPAHDAAQAYCGGSWRMPTDSEFSSLNSNCDWTWTTKNGVSGYVVRGRGDFADACIFLPGVGEGDGTSLYDAGSFGYYWSSVPSASNPNLVPSLLVYSAYHYVISLGRSAGRVVRPVQGPT